MQFTVPQFIDVEDKIIGPITVRQFIISIVGMMVLFLEYKLSDFTLFIVLAVITTIVFGSVAFLKINGMPFHYFFINFLQTLKEPTLRIWGKLTVEPQKDIKSTKVEPAPIIKKSLTASHLADLSLIVDTGGQYRGKDVEADDSFFKKEDK